MKHQIVKLIALFALSTAAIAQCFKTCNSFETDWNNAQNVCGSSPCTWSQATPDCTSCQDNTAPFTTGETCCQSESYPSIVQDYIGGTCATGQCSGGSPYGSAYGVTCYYCSVGYCN